MGKKKKQEEQQDELLFPPNLEEIDILFFWMECNRCGYRWLHVCGVCPHCHRIDFRVMDAQEVREVRLAEIFANDIHYVFLAEDS